MQNESRREAAYECRRFLFYSALPGRDSCAGDSGSGLMMDVELPARPYDPRWIQASFVILKLTLEGG